MHCIPLQCRELCFAYPEAGSRYFLTYFILFLNCTSLWISVHWAFSTNRHSYCFPTLIILFLEVKLISRKTFRVHVVHGLACCRHQTGVERWWKFSAMVLSTVVCEHGIHMRVFLVLYIWAQSSLCSGSAGMTRRTGCTGQVRTCVKLRNLTLILFQAMLYL